jgi:hypothetical protein
MVAVTPRATVAALKRADSFAFVFIMCTSKNCPYDCSLCRQ